jgi:hypothetical protein
MSGLRSFERFNYLLRPAKQVERKLIAEVCHRLDRAAWPVPVHSYTYVGMGSIYYADFLLFHRSLSVGDMICVEEEKIPRRMRFNKPFPFISLRMCKMADAIPKLPRRKPLLLWLDYEGSLDEKVLGDVRDAVRVLAPRSLLVVTVNADRRALQLVDESLPGARERNENALEGVREVLGGLVDREIVPADLSSKGLASLFTRALRNAIDDAASKRPGLAFFPLFSFRYSDGQRMVSMGGLLADAADQTALNACGVYDLEAVSTEPDPIDISIPPLTQKEREWLTRRIDRIDTPTALTFELEPEQLESFRKYYRYYPGFVETLL